MQPVKVFATLDTQLTEILSEFADLTNQLKFRYVCELSEAAKISRQKYPGVYKIDIRNNGRFSSIAAWTKWFISEWDSSRYVGKFTPTTKKRINKHIKLKTWMPLYVGKSQHVDKRVWEHINLGLKKRTFAMKLKARGKFFTENRFRLSTIHIDVDHYALILPMVERALRDRFHPVVGRH